MFFKKFVWLGLIFLFVSGEVSAQSKQQKVKPVKLEAYKRIDAPAREEVSGIIKSKQYKDTFWVHGDSGTKDRIYAINADGEIKSGKKNYKGTEIEGAQNKDWEDIASGPNGTLIIADIGNNCLCRNDLKIFIVSEPDPSDSKTEVIEEYEIEYPRGNGVSDFFFKKNLNAEAVFVKDGVIHIISKVVDKKAKSQLFKLENPSQQETNTLTFVEDFQFDELVTAADISQDESRLAVLTRESVWLFEPGNDGFVFSGTIKWLPIRGIQQVESITFHKEELIIAEENGELYRLPISRLVEYEN